MEACWPVVYAPDPLETFPAQLHPLAYLEPRPWSLSFLFFSFLLLYFSGVEDGTEGLVHARHVYSVTSSAIPLLSLGLQIF